MGEPRRAPILPRMLKKDQAAEYCGLSVPAFDRICPVPATALTDDVRMNRYDVKLLDLWLDSFRPSDTQSDDDLWIEKMRRGANAAA